MDTLDSVNRPGTGPLPPPDANEHHPKRKPTTIAIPSLAGSTDEISTPAAFVSGMSLVPSIIAPSQGTVMLPAPTAAAPTQEPETVTAADIELSSKRYVSALLKCEKAKERVTKARAELAEALAEESSAVAQSKTLQQELLTYLK